ncbi:type VI secretion system baseplate subunit TssG [Sulfurimonas sp. HSL3-2]|uniref:type VI secretion system baseplate subunit TssG n=1 Tax=Hydrocurvibacter mobilis TaxID=3131936 RepID=UPI0031F9922B
MMNIDTINQSIELNIKKYSLPQAIRVILHYLKELYQTSDYELLYKKIRFEGNSSLAFQKSELDSIEFFENEAAGKRVSVKINFLSLFGSSSPLPSHYNETVLRSFEGDRILYDFLNLFNHNLQRFIYPVWEKHRYYVKYNKDLKDGFSKYLLSLLGLYANFDVEHNKLDFQKIMPYIGVLSMRQKSAGTLTSILRHYLGFDEIEILQCIKMQSKIPSWQYARLGQTNSQLGVNLNIGEFVINKTSKFRILLNNVRVEDMLRYSIHGNKMDELNDLISFALNEPLEYDVCLGINEENKVSCVLDESEKRYIGINCWIGEPTGNEQIIIAQKG